MNASPLLSLVMTGRNDNHNGDFDRRCEFALRHNAALLAELGLPYELIWVEWNPLPGHPPLGYRVREWVPETRVLTVPDKVHRHICDNPALGMLQFHAKNVGIRRAVAPWILAMNADTYLTANALVPITSGTADPKTVYLAVRKDFPASLLAEPPPHYPIPDLEQRTVLLASEIDIPRRFGNAGDFTLMSRELAMDCGGHFEGIRFSNQHLDTLLALQARHLGAGFKVIGDVWHADHADSWNNFKVGDDKRHHHGFNFDWNAVALPYANPPNWGLNDYWTVTVSRRIEVLVPPKGTVLRKVLPGTTIIPPEYAGLAEATTRFLESVDALKTSGKRVAIYGLGDQVRQMILAGRLQGVNLIGYLDDNRSFPELPLPRLDWSDLADRHCETILIGSLFWATQLKAKAIPLAGTIPVL